MNVLFALNLNNFSSHRLKMIIVECVELVLVVLNVIPTRHANHPSTIPYLTHCSADPCPGWEKLPEQAELKKNLGLTG